MIGAFYANIARSTDDIESYINSAFSAVNPDTGELSEYPSLVASSEGPHWEESCSQEIARLCQGGFQDIKGTETMHFIHHRSIPKGRRPTYCRVVCTDHPQKSQPRHVRYTVGGDRIHYPGNVSTTTAGLPTTKIIFNSTISTPGARFACFDIKDFYLNTHMTRYEYMRLHISQVPKAIIMELYNLWHLVHNNYLYVEICKGMYGLPQAGQIANDELVIHLAKHGYHQCEHTHGLFRHDTRPIAFSLVVDDFGVKYVGMFTADILDTKVVDDEAEGNGTGFVAEESMGVLTLVVAMLG